MSKPSAVEEIAAEFSQAPRPRHKVLRTGFVAGIAAALGAGLSLAVEDPGFGWLGAISTAAVLGSPLAHRAGQPLLASLLGTAGFFGASILASAAALLAGLAAIPRLLG